MQIEKIFLLVILALILAMPTVEASAMTAEVTPTSNVSPTYEAKVPENHTYFAGWTYNQVSIWMFFSIDDAIARGAKTKKEFPLDEDPNAESYPDILAFYGYVYLGTRVIDKVIAMKTGSQEQMDEINRLKENLLLVHKPIMEDEKLFDDSMILNDFLQELCEKKVRAEFTWDIAEAQYNKYLEDGVDIASILPNGGDPTSEAKPTPAPEPTKEETILSVTPEPTNASIHESELPETYLTESPQPTVTDIESPETNKFTRLADAFKGSLITLGLLLVVGIAYFIVRSVNRKKRMNDGRD